MLCIIIAHNKMNVIIVENQQLLLLRTKTQNQNSPVSVSVTVSVFVCVCLSSLTPPPLQNQEGMYIYIYIYNDINNTNLLVWVLLRCSIGICVHRSIMHDQFSVNEIKTVRFGFPRRINHLRDFFLR